MAVRPVFHAVGSGPKFVTVELVNFEWFPGMAASQKQRSIGSLHAAISETSTGRALEISSKSKNNLGVELSAFNLSFQHPKSHEKISVESAFQGSKVFQNAGPFPDLYAVDAREAKRFHKENKFGSLTSFSFFGQIWPLQPPTVFYDWVYTKTLSKNLDFTHEVLAYEHFTDIEFNPKKSLNCQAYAAALFVSLRRRGLLDHVLSGKETFLEMARSQGSWLDSTPYGKYHMVPLCTMDDKESPSDD